MQADIKQLRVYTKGLSAQQQALVNSALEQYSSDGQTVLETDETVADIVIMDLNQHHDTINLADYRRQYPHRPIIGLGQQVSHIDHVIYLPQPMRVSALQLALHQAHRMLVVAKTQLATASPHLTPRPMQSAWSQSSTQSMPSTLMPNQLEDDWLKILCEQNCIKLDPNNPEQCQQAEFDPNHYLHSLLQQVVASAPAGQAIKIETEELWLLITPQNNKITVNLDDNGLFKLCRSPLSPAEVHMTYLSHQQTEIFLAALQDNKNLQHLDAFLWKTALWAALGRIPKGTNLHARVRLNQWPNMTRLYLFPHATRIAALWHGKAYSLLDTAEILDIPLCYVFAFYTAALTLALIDIEVQHPKKPIVKPIMANSIPRDADRLAIRHEEARQWLTAMRKWLYTTRLHKTSQPVV